MPILQKKERFQIEGVRKSPLKWAAALMIREESDPGCKAKHAKRDLKPRKRGVAALTSHRKEEKATVIKML
jgi:hypothetical protein